MNGNKVPNGAPEPATQKGRFPLNKLTPIVVGMVYGLLLRVIFSGNLVEGIEPLGVMTAAFVLFVPIAIGAITVYVAEKIERKSFLFYFFGPWLSITLVAIGAAITQLEGSICIAIAMPLFLVLGSASGVAMGVVCRLLKKPARTVQSIAILPFLFSISELGRSPPADFHEVKRSVLISSTPDVVWHHINFPIGINPAELEGGFAYRIGIPFPVEARTLTSGVGGKRHLIWQRGISFDEEITAWEENRHIAWKYIFNQDSFPPGSMDEHVVIGGQYFNLVDTSYTLSPENGKTRLEITVKFTVSTTFNWYATPWATFLITDTANAILHFYKNRSEVSMLEMKLIT